MARVLGTSSGGSSRRSRTRWAVVLAALVAVMLAAPAEQAAAATKPAPTCAGLAFTDPPGDATNFLFQPAQSNMDVLGGFFTTVPRGSGVAATANVQVANLSRSLPGGTSGIEWDMYWRVGDVGYYALARAESAGTSFAAGSYDAGTGLPIEDFETTGALFEGANGVVQVAIPSAAAPKGATLEEPYAGSFENVAGVAFPDDYGPDTGGGRAYKVAVCPAPALQLAASPARAKAGKSTRFSFRTTTSRSGRRVAVGGAIVSFAGRKAKTSSRGVAAITAKLKAGRYRAVASRSGYRSAAVYVRVS